MDEENIWEQDAQIIPSDSDEEEEEEEGERDEEVVKCVSFAKEDVTQSPKKLQDQIFENIDFSEFDILYNEIKFPANALKIIDQYLQQYQKIINKGLNISPDNFESFNQKLNTCCEKAKNASIFTKKEEKIRFELEFHLRLSAFFLISFIATKSISYINSFLEIMKKIANLMNFHQNESNFFHLQKQYYMLRSTYSVLNNFDSFENISNVVSWLSFEENHSFKDELFAPYVCLADGIRSFTHRLYKQAVTRSYTAFNLFPDKDIELKKKCLVIYYFSSLFLTDDIKIRPKSIQEYFDNLNFLHTQGNLGRKKQKNIPISQKNNQEDKSSNNFNDKLQMVYHNEDNKANSNKDDTSFNFAREYYADDENLKLILDFVKYHQNCDYESANLKAKDLCQQVGQTYNFVMHIPYNGIVKIIKNRAVIRFLAVFNRVQVNFIFHTFSFDSIEETRNLLIDMIKKREIKHFLNDLTDTLEIVDSSDCKKEENDPVKLMKRANELLSSIIDSFV